VHDVVLQLDEQQGGPLHGQLEGLHGALFPSGVALTDAPCAIKR
jgi:hypothetical protein